MNDAGPFKVTWPTVTARAEPDLDLKRPGLVDPRTREVVLRGAVPGPPARPGPHRRRGSRA